MAVVVAPVGPSHLLWVLGPLSSLCGVWVEPEDGFITHGAHATDLQPLQQAPGWDTQNRPIFLKVHNLFKYYRDASFILFCLSFIPFFHELIIDLTRMLTSRKGGMEPEGFMM